MCIPISMYNLGSTVTIERIERDGPTTYATSPKLLEVDLAPATSEGDGPSGGRYLLRHTDHCVGIYVKGGDVTIFDSRRAMSVVYEKIIFFPKLRYLGGSILFQISRGAPYASSLCAMMHLSASSQEKEARATAHHFGTWGSSSRCRMIRNLGKRYSAGYRKRSVPSQNRDPLKKGKDRGAIA